MSLANLASRSRYGFFGQPTHPTARRAMLSFSLSYQGDPYVGPASVAAFVGTEAVKLVQRKPGPALQLLVPSSMVGVTCDLVVSADAGGGVVTGIRGYVLGAADESFVLELDVSSDAPDTSIIGRVAGALIGYETAIKHEVIVVGIDAPTPKPLARVLPDPAGHYDATWYEYTGRVIAVAVGDQGSAWTPDVELLAGDVIVPSAGYAGHVFVVTAPGSSGAIEPVWWTTPGQSGPVGTATAVCRTYPRPVATGPVSPDVTIVSP